MTTKLAHSDHILRAGPGEAILAVEPASGVNMRAGGVVNYPVGARFRVEFPHGGLIWCLDDEARSVAFDREGMFNLEREGQRCSFQKRRCDKPEET